MFFTKSEIQNLRNNPLPQNLVGTLLYAANSIATAKAESRNTPLKKMLTEIILIDEIRYLNAYYGKDYSHKDILFAFCTEGMSGLHSQIELVKKCARYAESMKNIYKILPATDFLKIHDALMKSDTAILKNHIDSAQSVLTDDVWQILNDFYSPNVEVPMLLKLALLWSELEDGFFDTVIHLFSKDLMLTFALNNSFEMNNLSLFAAKQIIARKPRTETIEAYVIYFLQALSEAAFSKMDLIIQLDFFANKIKDELNDKIPKLNSDNILSLLNNHLLINNAMAEELLRVSAKTTISYLKQLEEIGILKSERVGRELYYINSYFMSYIEKDFR